MMQDRGRQQTPEFPVDYPFPQKDDRQNRVVVSSGSGVHYTLRPCIPLVEEGLPFWYRNDPIHIIPRVLPMSANSLSIRHYTLIDKLGEGLLDLFCGDD